jgi:hypothetical protein
MDAVCCEADAGCTDGCWLASWPHPPSPRMSPISNARRRPPGPRMVPQTILPLREITLMIMRNRGNIQLGGGADDEFGLTVADLQQFCAL